MKQKLWTINTYRRNDVELVRTEYYITHDVYGISVEPVRGGISVFNMSPELYKRSYGDDPYNIVKERREWLIKDVLTSRTEKLNSVIAEIGMLDRFMQNYPFSLEKDNLRRETEASDG